MSILSTTKVGKFAIIYKWLEEELNLNGAYVSVSSDGGIRVNGNVNLLGYPNAELPKYIQFEEIKGNFLCSYSKLESTKGFPHIVTQAFDCSFSQLSSLNGMPQKVGGNFICKGTPFTEEEIKNKVNVNGEIWLMKKH